VEFPTSQSLLRQWFVPAGDAETALLLDDDMRRVAPRCIDVMLRAYDWASSNEQAASVGYHLTRDDYATCFPYWSLNYDPINPFDHPHYMLLLMRVNLALTLIRGLPGAAAGTAAAERRTPASGTLVDYKMTKLQHFLGVHRELCRWYHDMIVVHGVQWPDMQRLMAEVQQADGATLPFPSSFVDPPPSLSPPLPPTADDDGDDGDSNGGKYREFVSLYPQVGIRRCRADEHFCTLRKQNFRWLLTPQEVLQSDVCADFQRRWNLNLWPRVLPVNVAADIERLHLVPFDSALYTLWREVQGRGDGDGAPQPILSYLRREWLPAFVARERSNAYSVSDLVDQGPAGFDVRRDGFTPDYLAVSLLLYLIDVNERGMEAVRNVRSRLLGEVDPPAAATTTTTTMSATTRTELQRCEQIDFAFHTLRLSLLPLFQWTVRRNGGAPSSIRDEVIPLEHLYPHSTIGLAMTEFGQPDVAGALDKIRFWHEHVSVETAVVRTYEKALTYRSHGRNLPPMLLAKCRKSGPFFHWIAHMLFCTLTGGYLKRFAAPPLPADMQDAAAFYRDPRAAASERGPAGFPGPHHHHRHDDAGAMYTTHRPRFRTLYLVASQLFEEAGPEKLTTFLSKQGLFVPYIIRENLVHMMHRKPYLRESQVVIDWTALEENVYGAMNYYRTQLDRCSTRSPHLGNANIEHLWKSWNCERALGAWKKKLTVYPFVKEDFVTRILSRMNNIREDFYVVRLCLQDDIHEMAIIHALLDGAAKQWARLHEGPIGSSAAGGDACRRIIRDSFARALAMVEKLCRVSDYARASAAGPLPPSSLDVSYRNKNARVEVAMEQGIWGLLAPVLDLLRTACSQGTDEEAAMIHALGPIRELLLHAAAQCTARLEDLNDTCTVPREYRQRMWDVIRRMHGLGRGSDGDETNTTADRDTPLADEVQRDNAVLVELFTTEGLHRYANLIDLYRRKVSPRELDRVLESMPLVVVTRLHFFLRLRQMVAKIQLVPLDADTTRRIGDAMRYHRFNLIAEERMPPSVYYIYLTFCCERIATFLTPNAYGHKFIVYDSLLGGYVCGKKRSKKAGIGRTGPTSALPSPDQLSCAGSPPDEGDDYVDDSVAPGPAPKKRRKMDSANGSVRMQAYRWAPIKTKRKIARQVKRNDELVPCGGLSVMAINMRGFRLSFGSDEKKRKQYQHCPACGCFHVYREANEGGYGGYMCTNCAQTLIERKPLLLCAYCNNEVSVEQAQRSFAYGFIDITNHRQPVSRLVLCAKHSPRSNSRTNCLFRDAHWRRIRGCNRIVRDLYRELTPHEKTQVVRRQRSLAAHRSRGRA
jgi:hypothetical protein